RLKRVRDWLAAGNGRLTRWLDGTEPSPSALLEAAELAVLVRETLTELSDDYEALLTAKYLDRQSVEQIAAPRKRTETAVRSRLPRAGDAFRQTFTRITGGTVYNAEPCNESH